MKNFRNKTCFTVKTFFNNDYRTKWIRNFTFLYAIYHKLQDRWDKTKSRKYFFWNFLRREFGQRSRKELYLREIQEYKLIPKLFLLSITMQIVGTSKFWFIIVIRITIMDLFFYVRFNDFCSLCCCCMCVDPETVRLGTRTGLPGNGVNKASVQNNSDMSANDSLLYVGRASTIGRSGKTYG